MQFLKSVLAAAVLLASLSMPGNAKSVWDQTNETAPLQPAFEDLQNTAP